MRVAALAMLLAGLTWVALGAEKKASKADRSKATTLPPITRTGLATTVLAERARESVVTITTRTPDGSPGGVGTGFFISTNGLVATSLHVIGEGRPVSVRTADGTLAPVISIYAWDRHADLAVLKVDGTRRSFLPLALANDVKQGAEVVAMGHPFGLEQSVVEGVISAEREVDGVSMLQLAMAVEPGNSGGPVVDRAGQVVGIVNAKAALTRNLGFATSVKLLSHLLEQPNATTLERWMHFNSLDTNEWTEVFGAAWHWHSGQIEVENPGRSFGGRALLLRRELPPPAPYELEVEVRLEDESGAAGLVFDSDGGAKHYGFYPTGGRIRVTAFGGPDVGSWQILQTLASEAYQPGEWNRLRVCVLADGFEGYINDQRVFAARERVFGDGLAGLAKFRDTKANFRSFSLRPLDAAELAGATFTAQSHSLASPAREWLKTNTAAGRSYLLREAADFERLAGEYRRAADRSHQSKVIAALRRELDQPEEKIGLFRAALLLAQFD